MSGAKHTPARIWARPRGGGVILPAGTAYVTGVWRDQDGERDVTEYVRADIADELLEALIKAKQEMWMAARDRWTMADFKNWAIIQQIDAAISKAEGQP